MHSLSALTFATGMLLSVHLELQATNYSIRGKRFGYRAYTNSEDLTKIESFERGYKLVPGHTPIYKSIEYLDRNGMKVLSTGSSDEWEEYMSETENTICGRKPLSVLLFTIEQVSKGRMTLNGFADSAERDSWGKLQWIGYAQSSKAKTATDSSVSYASGFAVA